MCGIWGLFGCEYDPKLHLQAFMSIEGRGPDFTICKSVAPNVVLGFHRLAIVMVSFFGIYFWNSMTFKIRFERK